MYWESALHSNDYLFLQYLLFLIPSGASCEEILFLPNGLYEHKQEALLGVLCAMVPFLPFSTWSMPAASGGNVNSVGDIMQSKKSLGVKEKVIQ